MTDDALDDVGTLESSVKKLTGWRNFGQIVGVAQAVRHNARGHDHCCERIKLGIRNGFKTVTAFERDFVLVAGKCDVLLPP